MLIKVQFVCIQYSTVHMYNMVKLGRTVSNISLCILTWYGVPDIILYRFRIIVSKGLRNVFCWCILDDHNFYLSFYLFCIYLFILWLVFWVAGIFCFLLLCMILYLGCTYYILVVTLPSNSFSCKGIFFKLYLYSSVFFLKLEFYLFQ